MKVGDAIATVAQPIARGIDAVAGTRLSGCGGCRKMRDNLNAGMSLSDAIYERWFKAKQQGEKMKFIIQSEIEADDVVQAMEKKNEATVISVNPFRAGQPPATPFGSKGTVVRGSHQNPSAPAN